MSSPQGNPWATGRSYVTVGGLERALKIAEYTLCKGSHVGDTCLNENITQEVENCASLVQIRSLKKIAELDEKINKLQQDIEWRKMLSNTSDITDPQSIHSMLSLLEDLCSHLQVIMDKKDSLTGRLQQAYDDHMVVDADYHRDVANCFPLLSEQLGLLSKNIDSMAWMHAFSMKGSNLNGMVGKLSSRLAAIQSFYQALNETRSLMASRLRAQDDTLRIRKK